ncbi:hypothetical protein BH11PLA2_BH11PLA2_35140 [soil metagenome]
MNDITRTKAQDPDSDPARRSGFLPSILPVIPGLQMQSILGEGGMGIVYKAVQTELNRVVAIKMINSGPTVMPMELQRFRSEAQALAAIEHPNVVRVFSSGDVEGRPYLAMEFLGGGNLGELIRKQGKLSARTVVKLVQKIALGIQAAHDRNIVHRDLKPANILFDTNAEPKVTDFGLAKREDSGLTASNAIMGTPAYMAPEQARGDSKLVGPQADLWALGVLLYECLTGVRPFRGEHNVDILNAVIAGKTEPMRKYVPNIAADLQMIVQRCLQKNLTDRYESAKELHCDLERWLRGEPMRPILTNTWQVRFESTGTMVPLTNPQQVLEGMRAGNWEATDEVRGPSDEDWQRIEDHPTFADAVSDLSPPRIEPADETHLDMNPLIDVTLVLLIFFILTTTVASLRRSIEVPAEPEDKKGQVATKVKPEDIKDVAFNVTLWMDNGVPRIKLEDKVIDVNELERAMLDQVRNTGRRQLILSVDGKAPWGAEAAVHDAAKGADITQIYRKKWKAE